MTHSSVFYFSYQSLPNKLRICILYNCFDDHFVTIMEKVTFNNVNNELRKIFDFSYINIQKNLVF
jgi:hypothetical protein